MAACCECGNEPSGFHKLRGISGVAERILISDERDSAKEIRDNIICIAGFVL